MTNISTYEHTPIVFGSAGFAGPLTITNTGEIHPTADPGAIALYIPVHVAKPTLVNDGFVVAGKGVYTDGHIYNGGIGIKVGAAATITNAGDIAGGYGGNVNASAAGYGGVGVYIFAKSVKLNNSGEISGGGGGVGNHINRIGAIGVAVYAASAVTNSGMITGGEGGQGDYSTNANNGGDGVLLANSARLTNSGTVIGGGGGFFFGTANAGIGGAGVYLNDATAINSGYIAGGRGGLEGGTGNGGAGGVGVAVLQGSFTNKGTVAGGAGYVGKGGISGDGGVGIVVYGSLASGSNVKAGVIIGGAGGTEVVTYMAGSPPNTYHIYSTAPGYALPGLEVGGGASFNNAGTVIGGASGATSNYNQNKAQPSGRGAVVSIGTLVNSGTISGGVAGQNIYGAYGLLGYEKAKLTNSGKIFGGAGGYGRDTGGDGVGLRNASTLTSSGRITGGAGGYQYRLGGTGGFGMAIDDSSASNSGVITGGAGGGGYYYGGAGGAGVQIENGKFTNTGLVVGGAGSYGHYGSGAGGIGVVLTASGTEASLGATLVNAGTIRGSHGADAVLVGNVGGTVVAENGAVFDGNVVASNGSFELAGTGSTAMAGFGTKITGFTSVDFATGAKWVISGDIAGLASGQTINGFGVGDGIKITDAAAAGGTVIVKKAGVVTVEVQGGTTITLDIANAKAGATNYNFANDKLSESNAKAAMAFITPNAEPKAESVPGWTTGFTLPPQFYGFTAAPPIAVQTHLTAAITGGTHDLVLKPQHAFDAMVTLHAG